MRILHSSTVRTLLTLVVSGCLEGTGSGIIGISNDSGGGVGTTGTRTLSFFVQPNTANVGQVITPPVQVVASDSTGSVDSTFTGTVSVALASNPSGAVLGGTTAVRAVRGLASFGSLSVDRVGSYTLRASAPGATSAVSRTFNITTPTAP